MSLLSLAQEVLAAAEAVSTEDNSRTHSRLLKTIHDLNVAAQTPTEAITSIIHLPKQYAALRTAIDMGLPRALVAVDGKSMTAAELSKGPSADVVFVGRVMRMLAISGLCDEVGEEEYKANAVTRELAKPSWSDGLKYSYLSMEVNAKFPEFMRATNFKNPEEKSPFEYTFGKPVWEYLKDHPDQQTNMMAFMSGRRGGASRWFNVFPLTSQIEASNSKSGPVTLVDVGGNKGHDLKLFQESHPDLKWRLILMDLPDVVKHNVGPSFDGIEIIGYDFFTPQPVKGAHIYYFHGILHDWSDARCRNILSNTASAMDTESRLLINDLVLPNIKAPLRGVALDFSMMTMCAGIERTETQWRSLLESVNLEIIKIWTADGVEAVIEAKLRT